MMSKDAYYQYRAEDTGSVDGLGLPSLPNTSYWYDAHSSMGSSLYPVTSAQDYVIQNNEGPVPISDSFREPMDWWPENEVSAPRNLTGNLCNIGGVDQGYLSTDDLMCGPSEFEPPGPAMGMLGNGFVGPAPGPGGEREYVAGMEEDMATDESQTPSPQSLPEANAFSSPVRKGVASDSRRPSPVQEQSAKEKKLKKEPKEKVKESKKCGVCGDTARSMHFGGMACDSCKAFFRRSVQSGAYKSFQCPENENCPISKQNRKVCQYCRFKKSQENGMEISWVMSETDRMVLWKNRLAKQRQEQEDKQKDVVYGGLPHTLDPDDADALRNLAALQEATFKSIPYPEDCYGDNVETLANLFVCICKKLGLFFYRVEDFQCLCKTDQSLLLKNGIGMGIYLHGAYMFDHENERWPAEGNKEALMIPPVSLDTLRKFTVFPEAFEVIMKFYKRYAKIIKDEIVLALVCVIAFFQPDDPNFLHPEKIQEIQTKYLEYLKRYLKAKEGDNGVRITFPKLLVGLADIREILEYHGKVDIKPTINYQEISTQPSVKNQMVLLKELFEKVSLGALPEFSSILTNKEKKQPLWDKNGILQKRQNAAVNVQSNQFYHPYTNQIFGNDPRTDMVITNPLEHIDRFVKKYKHSFTQISNPSEGRETCRNSSAHRRLPSLKPAGGGDDENYQREMSVQSDQSDWQLQRAVRREQNFNSMSAVDKKHSVDILCNILNHICADDEQFIQSLKRDLPPHLLASLAQKLLPS
ncbi:oxysterols receptor LXR-beta-like [Penaeus chinensis]|uniref:oxysterols receptor LXR-beta-like n=1 Tax=Penaeus chinensis TaxID=139456 RepID=UPI001FB6942D|nr:oxysterols receptor LXR-beta-like [Penaeus chinensis]XP_047474810.1 oxysterols receptor LXR-beta-like [Penaeus chinensis]XP_047474811.1 oxysterols receptor LXR-beta-like [Penaeus chinensis]